MDYEQLSQDGSHKVTVTAPAGLNVSAPTGLKKSQITVSKLIDSEWVKAWTTPAVNTVEPAKAYLDDRGSCVITLGNWNSGVAGKDELVVYQEGKLLQKYSLPDLVGDHFDPLFICSTIPAWLSDSFANFHPNLGFSLWLDSAEKWIVVDLTNGSLRTIDRETELQCQILARQASLKRIKKKKGDFSDYRLLSRFLRPNDQPLFKELLTRPFENLGSGTVSETSAGLLHYFSSSNYRDLAEAALDALKKGEQKADLSKIVNRKYRLLGALKISATFDRVPQKDDGVIALWLEPTSPAKVPTPTQSRPAHSLGIDLAWHYPDHYTPEGKTTSKSLPMIIYGITPGRYTVHGSWKQDSSYLSFVDKDFWKEAGDFSVMQGPKITITAGDIAQVEVMFQMTRPPGK
ncbi:hypothetical protein N9165_01810 [Akkermansiaceae bacterium]|nr:hypothetical protein [Akkermansiaceae bacterium]